MGMMTSRHSYIFGLLFWLLFSMVACAQEYKFLDQDKFINPPASSKPKTWMHVMSSNMSKEGMTKDLQAISKVGIGGILLFNVTHTIPSGNVEYNSDEHHDIIKHAAQECERLGLSFGVHNCDGWTSSGGPWIDPEHSMKLVVWSDVVVNSDGKVDIKLPKPTARHEYYVDEAVLAYPATSSEIQDASFTTVITSSDPDFDTDLIHDGRWDKHSVLSASEEQNGWIQFVYNKPLSAQSLFMSLTKTISGSRKGILQISDDGFHFKDTVAFNLLRLGKREFAIDLSFPEIVSKIFRVVIEDDYEIMETRITARPNYNNFLARTSLFKLENHRIPKIDESNDIEIIDNHTIVNLTEFMDNEGNLHATLPKGKWTILRFGYSITGAVNSPASDAGRGLEVDKMSKEALDIHYNAFVGKVVNNTRSLAPNALQYLEIDSYEVGGQNWTKGYKIIFKEKFGYDLTNYLPLYTGRLVASIEESESVLWDIRRLNSELITENYFGHFTELTHQDGLISYIEPYSFNAPFNELDAGKNTDIPMGEFWMHQRYQAGTAVSSARIYGKPIVSAESFSARSEINWKGHPGLSKLTGDHAWALGINEFMFHRYAHQANTHVKPGMVMSQWGSHIDRTQTWWENAGAAWFEYIARGSYLLRQGVPVSDLLIYVGEGSPNSVTSRNAFKDLPLAINYDNVNTDVLENRIKAKDGKLILPEGTSYKALVLTNIETITLSTLRRIRELADAGVVIIGDPPKKMGKTHPPKDSLKLFNALVDNIWSREKTYDHYDFNKIYQAEEISYDLHVAGKEDVMYTHRKIGKEDFYFFFNKDSSAQVFDCHFNVEGLIPEIWNPMTGEITKVLNFSEKDGITNVPIYLEGEESMFVVFRESSEGVNQIVDIKSKAIVPPSVYSEKDKLIFTANENDTYRLTFQNGQVSNVKAENIPGPLYINSPWKIEFSKESEYDKDIMTDTLFDWRDGQDFDLKHYSGTAVYSTLFQLDHTYLEEGLELELDLGNVQVAAEISLNGEDLGVLWKSPYRIKIHEHIKKQENKLTIKVTNTWTNRLIGDEYFERTDGYKLKSGGSKPNEMPDWYIENRPMPAGKRTTFAAYPFYKKDDPLLSSGLLGPVKIIAQKTIAVNDQE